jgi:hypothetical protein
MSTKTVGTFTSVFKNKKSKRSKKNFKIKVFLTFRRILVHVLTDPDPGLGGPKTYGSGSTTLLLGICVPGPHRCGGSGTHIC